MAAIVQNDIQYEFSASPQTINGVGQRPKYRANQNIEFDQQQQDDDQMDMYEELTDIPPDDEKSIQPDFYIDRPPTPIYKPKQSGIDVSTQIEHYEPELFDFVLEVEPILQVIVGKIIEQSRIELIEEYEKDILKLNKGSFQRKRNAELMVTQRMEAAYNRRKNEKERRELQHELYNEQLKLMQKKLMARMLSKQTLQGTKQSILQDLENLGFLRDNKQITLHQHTIPWIINKIYDRVSNKQKFGILFQNMLKDTQDISASEHARHYKVEMDKRAKILMERESKRIEIEERKQRKAEIKRRWALRDIREKLKQNIQSIVLDKAEAVDQVFNAKIFEGLSDNSEQKNYVCLQNDLLFLIASCLDLMIDGDIDQMDDQMILNLLIELLCNKMLGELELNMNQDLSEFHKNMQQEMEKDVALFNKTFKQQCLKYYVQQTQNQNLWSNYITRLSYIESEAILRKDILSKVMIGLMDIQYKSINYLELEANQEQEQQQQQEQQEQEQQEQQQDENKEQVTQDDQYENEEKKQDIFKPEITQLDLEMIEAKKKINIKFKKVINELPLCDALIRLNIPLESNIHHDKNDNSIINRSHSNTQQTNSKHIQSIVQNPILDEEIVQPQNNSKWDFDPKTIDIYDGEQIHIREGKQINLYDEQGFSYNFNQLKLQNPVLILDQRANYISRKEIYYILKDRLESFFNIVPFDQFIEKFRPIDNNIYNSLKKEIQSKYPNTPLFDYDL